MIKIDTEKCEYKQGTCTNCVEVCPTDALTKEDIIVFEPDRCVDCCLCITACKNNAIKAA